MLEPKLILLDEPAGGVNPSLLGRLTEVIRELNRSGVTFLVVEHNIPLVLGPVRPGRGLRPRQARSRRGRPGRSGTTRSCSTPTWATTGGRGRADGRPSERSADVLTLDGVVAGYGGGNVLQGVDLHCADRTVTCIVGPNGAGKSTVLRVISGLLRCGDGHDRRWTARAPSRLPPEEILALRHHPGAAVARRCSRR